jgi:hypothetical protein
LVLAQLAEMVVVVLVDLLKCHALEVVEEDYLEHLGY